MRKLVYHIATTLDGYVEGENGALDFFVWEGDHVTDFLEAMKTYDTVLMGRKTYDFGLKQGVSNPYPTMQTYVFSRTLSESPDANVTLVSDNSVEFVRNLKNAEGGTIWLAGAGSLATTFFEAGLIDEVVIKLNPVLVGSGVPLLSSIGKALPLKLTSSKEYGNGVLLLQYEVQH